jgi:hypothetical protein
MQRHKVVKDWLRQLSYFAQLDMIQGSAAKSTKNICPA